jgi:hypothetical protein
MRRHDDSVAQESRSPCHDKAVAIDEGISVTPEVGTGQKRMRRRLIGIVLGIGASSLAGCASHTYAPGPGMSAMNQGRDEARCRLFARGTRPDTSFEVSGSARSAAIFAGAGLLTGAIVTAVHDSETNDDCMEARGYQITDGRPAGPNPQQPIAMTAAYTLPAPAPPYEVALSPTPVSTAEAERVTRAARAERTAEAWLIAERILDRPDSDREKFRLYKSLCGAGDNSACVMTEALAESVR